MKTLRDKVIIITGAGGSIAGAVAEAFHKAGARIVLVDKDSVRTQGRASSYGGMALESDFATLKDAQDVITQVKEQMGRIDGLIHLVGEKINGNVINLNETDYSEAFDTNVRTLFNTVKAALPELLQNDEAFIAGVGSQEAWGGGAANSSLFAAAKSAVATFLRSLDAELASTNVGVAIVFPMGMVDTLSNRKVVEDDTKLIHPRALASALLSAALSGEDGSLLELLIHPPRRAVVRA